MKPKQLLFIMILAFLAALTAGCGGKSEKTVVIYTSVDQEYAEPILKKFEVDTGIKVLPVFDVEAAKTTGLVNRLLTEKNRPQADVFWNSEFMQTMLLKEQGVLAVYQSPAASDLPSDYRDKDGYWTASGGRVRVLIVNTNLVAPSEYPKSIFELASGRYANEKSALAYPMFGTTATHAAALYAEIGPAEAKKYFLDLKKNKVQAVDGNSVVRDLVASGQLKMGLTDSDDACGAVKKGAPVAIVIPDQEGMGTMVIPNTVAMIAGAPHLDTAKILVDYLVSAEVEQVMLKNGASQLSARGGAGDSACLNQPMINRMKTDYESIYQQLRITKKEMADIFVR